MKYLVLLCDGMADTPCPELNGKTPMEAAYKPHMDSLAAISQVGTVQTVPTGMSPGSDVANLSVLGYDVSQCYTGRSPLEAANTGVEMAEDDVAFRCNLVTLSEQPAYPDKTMVDYCAGDIHTAQADIIIQALQQEFGGGEFDFYTGTAYRHCLIWHKGKVELGKLTPPHDIPGQRIGDYLPAHPDAAPLLDLMRKSVAFMASHPQIVAVNRQRIEQGLSPANAIWLWGQGKRPRLQDYYERFQVKASMISAVDLLKGIGRLANMQVCQVEGATGYIDTNYIGKMTAAFEELKRGQDFVYIHIEAPDECGHRGEVANKVRAIEDIDRLVLGPLLQRLPELGDFTLLILPDHPTPLAVRTHTADPVPYLLYRSNVTITSGLTSFTEASAAATGHHFPVGHQLMPFVLKGQQ